MRAFPFQSTTGDRRRHVRQSLMARSLAGLVTAALLLSACGSGDSSSAPEPDAASAAPGGGGSPAGDNGEDQSSNAKAPALTQEEFFLKVEQEIQRCMTAKGWEYEVMDQDAIATMINGSIDNGDPASYARQNGYGITGFEISADQLSQNPNDAYIRSLSPTEADAYLTDLLGASSDGTMPMTGGGCSGEATGKVAGPDGIDAMSQQFATNQELINADPGLIEARKQWSLCMAEAGHSYATAEDAVADLSARFDAIDKADQAAVDEFKAEEIAVAVADVECQARVGLTEAYEEARARVTEQEANG